MADVGAKIIGGVGKAAIKELAKQQAAQDVRRVMPRDDGQAVKVATTLVSITIDGLYDLYTTPGSIQNKTLHIVAFKAAAATLPALSSDQKVACVAALLALAADARGASAQVAFVAGAEFATGGLATPIIAMQAALLVKSAADVLSSAINANQQCGPLAVRGYESIKADWSQFAGGLEAAITRSVLSTPIPLN